MVSVASITNRRTTFFLDTWLKWNHGSSLGARDSASAAASANNSSSVFVLLRFLGMQIDLLARFFGLHPLLLTFTCSVFCALPKPTNAISLQHILMCPYQNHYAVPRPLPYPPFHPVRSLQFRPFQFLHQLSPRTRRRSPLQSVQSPRIKHRYRLYIQY